MSTRRFTSKLQPVRAVREHAELLAISELARALRHAEDLRRQVEVAQALLQDARPAGGAGGVTASELAVRQAYLERVERELAGARFRVAAHDDHLEATRARVQRASRELGQVDKLDERRRAAHELEERRRDRSAGDEVALRMHLAGRAGA